MIKKFLTQFEENAHQRGCDARQKRKEDTQRWVIPIVSAVAGYAFTLIAEHIGTILAFFSHYFH